MLDDHIKSSLQLYVVTPFYRYDYWVYVDIKKFVQGQTASKWHNQDLFESEAVNHFSMQYLP